jgi:hypothetical protein
MHDRAERRFQKEKALKRSLNRSRQLQFSTEEERILWAKKQSEHPASCSCRMCGNPRKHLKGDDKLTLAEIKQRDSEADV